MSPSGRVLFRAVCLSVTLIGIVGAAEPNRLSRHVLTLRPAQTPELRIELSRNFRRTQPPFEKEPSFEGKSIVRGWIPTEPPTPLIRNITDGQLYAKADHDQDFTRGTLDTYASQCRDGMHVSFAGMQVFSRQGSLAIPYTVDLWTYRQGLSGWLQVRSGWTARFEEGDRQWTLTVIDNLDGRIDGQDRLILEQISPANGPSATHECPVPEILFFDGQAIHLDFAYKQTDTGVVLEATLTDLQLPMGDLRVDAEGCRSLALRDGRRIVLLGDPAGVLSVPAGRYRVDNCVLDYGADHRVNPRFAGCDTEVCVEADRTATLLVGLPLSNQIVVTRDRNVLHLDYRLIGAGGERYGRDQIFLAPLFRIYKGPVKIATGSFGFG
jgi:hypothetical protein